MPTKTWNIEQIDVGGTNPLRLWWDEDNSAVPAQTTSATGWTVAKTAANNYRLLAQGQEVAGFAATVQPTNTAPAVDNTYTATAIYTPPNIFSDVESISTLYPYNGVFPAGNWVFSFPVIAVGSGGDQDGNIRMRVFKGSRNSTDDGWVNVTELTSAVLIGTTVTNLTTTVAQTSTITWAAPAIRLNDEYLICKIAWLITGAGGANTRDVLLRFGTGATMVSTNFKKRSYNIT